MHTPHFLFQMEVNHTLATQHFCWCSCVLIGKAVIQLGTSSLQTPRSSKMRRRLSSLDPVLTVGAPKSVTPRYFLFTFSFTLAFQLHQSRVRRQMMWLMLSTLLRVCQVSGFFFLCLCLSLLLFKSQLLFLQDLQNSNYS